MGDMKNWTFRETLPSLEEIEDMKRVFGYIIGRVLSRRMRWMKTKPYDMSEYVTWELKHDEFESMSRKSEEVIVWMS